MSGKAVRKQVSWWAAMTSREDWGGEILVCVGQADEIAIRLRGTKPVREFSIEIPVASAKMLVRDLRRAIEINEKIAAQLEGLNVSEM